MKRQYKEEFCSARSLVLLHNIWSTQAEICNTGQIKLNSIFVTHRYALMSYVGLQRIFELDE